MAQPDGQITSINQNRCQAPPRKIFIFRFSEMCDYLSRILPPHEGRIAIVTDVGGGMRWTSECSVRFGVRTKGIPADGESVWSRSPDAGIKPANDEFVGDGGYQARHPEESTYKP
jgi:hypothetical protein